MELLKSWELGLRYGGRPPRTVWEKQMARAEHKHACRLAELKRIREKVEQFTLLAEQLAAHDIDVASIEFTGYDSKKELSLRYSVMSTDDRFANALIACGFRVLKIEGPTYMRRLQLKHGRALLVTVYVSEGYTLPAGSEPKVKEPAC